jgi:transposase InsO family protein
MDYFTKRPEAYTIPNQEASTVADALVTIFCRFGVPRELHSDLGSNFESRLVQEVLQRLGVSKTRATPLQPQSDGMVDSYGRGATMKSRRIAPEGLGRKISHPPHWLQDIYSWYYRLDPG